MTLKLVETGGSLRSSPEAAGWLSCSIRAGDEWGCYLRAQHPSFRERIKVLQESQRFLDCKLVILKLKIWNYATVTTAIKESQAM